MEIADDLWAFVESEIQRIHHGTVTLIVQDGRLIQLDKAEKIRLNPADMAKVIEAGSAPGKKQGPQQLRARIAQALRGLRFGQLVIVLKDNSVVQIEKVEKHRVSDLAGFGDGI